MNPDEDLFFRELDAEFDPPAPIATAENGSQRADLQSGNEGVDWPARFAGAGSNRKVVYDAYIHSPEWAAKRIGALERAGDHCQVCNAIANLHVHHRTYDRAGDEAPQDLTVLCRHCHNLFHRNRKVSGKKRSKRRSISRATHTRCYGCGKNWTTKGLCKPCRKKPKVSRVQRINRGTIRMRALAKKCPACGAPKNAECVGILRGLTHSERCT